MVLARRRAMPGAQVQRKSRMIQDRLFALPEYGVAAVIHCYVSSKDNEVDTYGVIGRALDQGKRVVVPVADFAAVALSHIEILSLDQLGPSRFGLVEPVDVHSKPVDISELDLVIVPGIAFDPAGHRLGYGAGFYDRFLAEAAAPKIALAYGFQVVANVPFAAHDVPMDQIITESRVYRVQTGAG